MFWPDFTLSTTEPCSPGRLYTFAGWLVLTFSACAGLEIARAIPRRISVGTLMGVYCTSTVPAPRGVKHA